MEIFGYKSRIYEVIFLPLYMNVLCNFKVRVVNYSMIENNPIFISDHLSGISKLSNKYLSMVLTLAKGNKNMTCSRLLEYKSLTRDL